MVTKRGKRPTKKVKTLKPKSPSADKEKRIRGGVSFGAKPVSVQPKSSRRAIEWTY